MKYVCTHLICSHEVVINLFTKFSKDDFIKIIYSSKEYRINNEIFGVNLKLLFIFGQRLYCQNNKNKFFYLCINNYFRKVMVINNTKQYRSQASINRFIIMLKENGEKINQII